MQVLWGGCPWAAACSGPSNAYCLKEMDRTINWPLVLISSIKGEVKKKHTSFGWNFSRFAAPLIERNLF